MQKRGTKEEQHSRRDRYRQNAEKPHKGGAVSAQVRHQRLGTEGVAYVDLYGLWILLQGIAVIDQMAYAVALLFRQTALRFEFAGITPFGFVASETAEGVSDEEWNARDVL